MKLVSLTSPALQGTLETGNTHNNNNNNNRVDMSYYLLTLWSLGCTC
jgi:hypothetical protein